MLIYYIIIGSIIYFVSYLDNTIYPTMSIQWMWKELKYLSILLWIVPLPIWLIYKILGEFIK
jgi:hypothetical protein